MVWDLNLIRKSSGVIANIFFQKRVEKIENFEKCEKMSKLSGFCYASPSRGNQVDDLPRALSMILYENFLVRLIGNRAF